MMWLFIAILIHIIGPVKSISGQRRASAGAAFIGDPLHGVVRCFLIRLIQVLQLTQQSAQKSLESKYPSTISDQKHYQPCNKDYADPGQERTIDNEHEEASKKTDYADGKDDNWYFKV